MKMMYFDYMHRDTLCARVGTNFIKVEVTNFTDNIFKTPFGNNVNPTVADLEEFLEDRCFPKSRADRKKLLERIGLDFYDVTLVTHYNHGAQLTDDFWIKYEGEDITYDKDIKPLRN